MNSQDRKTLQERFGDRVSFEKTERLLYSHDTASLPGMVKRMIKAVPDAVVQPVSADDVVFIVGFARQRGISLTPRGAATSGWGGALPSRGGIVVEMTRMHKILEINPARGVVRVEPGVIWKNLDYELGKHGLACRTVPSSAPSATIGGWVAEGGGGIGSYEYGEIGNNIQSATIVTPSGEVRKLEGDEIALAVQAEGTTGIITEVVVKVREADRMVPVVGSFASLTDMLKALQDVNDRSLNLWHVSFAMPKFLAWNAEAEQVAAQIHARWGHESRPHNEGHSSADGRCRALFVYPAKCATTIQQPLNDAIAGANGHVESDAEAQKEWDNRFYPIRLKRLGPSLISSESVVSVPFAQLGQVIQEIEAKFPDIAIEGTMISKQQVSLLGHILADERSPAYTFEFPKSLDIIQMARRHGGRPYSTGLYFTGYARQNLGDTRAKRLGDFKRSVDPSGIMNPGKVLPQNRNPFLLKTTMNMAGLGGPFLAIGRKVFSHKPKLARLIPQDTASEAYACAQCGYCLDVCDQYWGRRWEGESSRGRWYFLREYLNGKAQFNQMMLDSFLLCTTCKRCNDVCQVQIPIQEMWDRMRGVVIHEKGYHTFPGFEMMASSARRQSNIWAGAREKRDAWIPADVKPLEKGKIAYWAGCTASYVEHDIAQNAAHILKEGGIEFAYLGKDEACCGIPFYAAGKWDMFEGIARHNIEEMNKRDVQEIVLSCPGCWVTLNHYYREWAKKLGLKYDIKVTHITEVTAQLVKEGRLTFKRAPKDGGNVTYHDPCHIGRHGGIYEPPREVLNAIPGVKLVEMEHNRKDGLCCGSVLSRVGRPPAADAIGSLRIGEAEETGANVCLTTCPCCEVQLRVGARFKKSKVRVLDWSDVVADALGYEQTDPTHNVLDAWDVFGTAIDMMTVDGMVEMMGKMMPEIMDAMPGYMKRMMAMMKAMPGPVREPMFKMMEKMVPMLMPRLMPGMMPALMPRAIALMKEGIPNMPPVMERMLPDMMPEVMGSILPPMLPRIGPKLAPAMTAFLRNGAKKV